jgi:hypothetical protein
LATAIPAFAVVPGLVRYAAALALGVGYWVLTRIICEVQFPAGVPRPDGIAPESISCYRSEISGYFRFFRKNKFC